MDNFLLWLIVLPALAALVGAFLSPQMTHKLALGVSLFMLAVALLICSQCQYSTSVLQFRFDGFQIFLSNSVVASFSLGIDTISLWLIVLTALLMPLAIAASFGSIKERSREYYCWMLLLSSAMFGVFAARDLLVFYVFFELTLVPMFFIIGIWGGPQRRYAAGKFFLFTFTGSVFTLAGAVYLGIAAKTFDIQGVVTYAQLHLSADERFWVLMAFLAGFAVKIPLFPVHTWLPLAHTEAPTAGSVILAGVLLKLGTYGLLRFGVPIGLIGNGGVQFVGVAQVLAVLCLVGIVYGALVAWVQTDIKKLVAYSSVSHLGFCVLGLIALNVWGVEGSILYMLNHGISTGALFLVVGMIYDRYHTRDINQLSGLAKRMPILSFFFVLFALSSIGLPGLNGFVSEFLTILGAFTASHLGMKYGAVAALGIILGAVYMLHMVARVIFGPLKTPGHDSAHDSANDAGDPHSHARSHSEGGHGEAAAVPGDINGREIAILIPLAVVVVWLGFFPAPLMRSLQMPVQQMLFPMNLSTQAQSAPQSAPRLAQPTPAQLTPAQPIPAAQPPQVASSQLPGR